MAQLVKNPPAVRETWVLSLGWEDPLEKSQIDDKNCPILLYANPGIQVIIILTKHKVVYKDIAVPRIEKIDPKRDKPSFILFPICLKYFNRLIKSIFY